MWYKLGGDILSQFPPNGTSCSHPQSPGSGSGSDIPGLGPRNDFNITGEVMANGSNFLLFNPVQFGDEGYYICVIQLGSEQQCFSSYVTVVGELVYQLVQIVIKQK